MRASAAQQAVLVSGVSLERTRTSSGRGRAPRAKQTRCRSMEAPRGCSASVTPGSRGQPSACARRVKKHLTATQRRTGFALQA
eukprot:981115-Rhodomonas_salina.1